MNFFYRWAFNHSTSSNTGSEGSSTKIINHAPGSVSDASQILPPDQMDIESNRVMQPSVVSSIASYTPESESDYGTLYCYARNSVGSQIDPCVFTIIPAGPPDPMKNCTILNTTEEMIKVECNEGYDGGLLQNFVAEVRDASIQKLYANVTSTWPSFQFKGLDSGTSYLVVLYAANSKGRSKPVVLTSTTKSLPESLNRLANGKQTKLHSYSFNSIFSLCSILLHFLSQMHFFIKMVETLQNCDNFDSFYLLVLFYVSFLRFHVFASFLLFFCTISFHLSSSFITCLLLPAIDFQHQKHFFFPFNSRVHFSFLFYLPFKIP